MSTQNAREERGATAENGAPVVLYDGGCPMCSREIAHYRRLTPVTHIEWIDVAQDPDRCEALGVAVERAMARFHVRDTTGNWHTGAFAFAELWRHLPGYRLLAWLLRASRTLPLVDRLYSRFAAWRLRRRCSDAGCGV